MARDAEWVPWYRRKGYKGDLTEAEKRLLDAVRLRDRHPATKGEDLPEDVKSYIEQLQIELYDAKQEIAVAKFYLAFFAVGFVGHTTWQWQTFPPLIGYPFAAALLLYAAIAYFRDGAKNDDELFPKKGAPDATNQGIQAAWEVNHIVQLEMRRDEEHEDFD